MNMRLSLHEDEKEEQKHFSAIQILAQDEGLNEEEIIRIYGQVLSEYKKRRRLRSSYRSLSARK